ncbi:MAG: TPM domain-containing protein [Ignavibacteria bacterium]|nr:MAG: TPM domain-containing protein [Ignavibacteria bacterium]
MSKLVYKYFNDDDFLLISEKIKDSEKRTSGEIRVSILEDKPLFPLKFDIRELAIHQFKKLGMDKTRDRTGILLLLVLKRKSFYILADEGINSLVEQGTWDNIRDEIKNEFLIGHYAEGIIKGLELITNVLEKYFPIKPDDVNELSNKVDIS